MSKLVAQMKKFKAENMNAEYVHVERKTDNHTNKDIDISKTHLNYDVISRENSEGYLKQVQDYVNKNKVGKRAIRKDAVLVCEWIISSDKKFFENKSEEEMKSFFEISTGYFAHKFGYENIAYAKVHLDESTPHMHLGIIPMRNGKLTAKTIFNKEELRTIQDELPQLLQNRGFEIERGEKGSTKKHLSTQEYKELMDTLNEIKEDIRDYQEEKEEMEEEIIPLRKKFRLERKEQQKLEEEIIELENKKEFLDTECTDLYNTCFEFEREIDGYKEQLGYKELEEKTEEMNKVILDLESIVQRSEEFMEHFLDQPEENIAGWKSYISQDLYFDWDCLSIPEKFKKVAEEIKQWLNEMINRLRRNFRPRL